MDRSEVENDDCDTCPIITSRRSFVRDTVALGVAGVLATMGLSKSASALPVSVIDALARTKSDVTYAVPAGDGVQIDKENEVILVRWQNAIYAFNLSCPHQRTALRWNAADKQFQCPKHKSKYTPVGSFISGRATRGMDKLAIRRQGGSIIVDVDVMYEEDENEAQWKAALVKLA